MSGFYPSPKPTPFPWVGFSILIFATGCAAGAWLAVAVLT